MDDLNQGAGGSDQTWPWYQHSGIGDNSQRRCLFTKQGLPLDPDLALGKVPGGGARAQLEDQVGPPAQDLFQGWREIGAASIGEQIDTPGQVDQLVEKGIGSDHGELLESPGWRPIKHRQNPWPRSPACPQSDPLQFSFDLGHQSAPVIWTAKQFGNGEDALLDAFDMLHWHSFHLHPGPRTCLLHPVDW